MPWQTLPLRFRHAEPCWGEATSAERDPSSLGPLSATAAASAQTPTPSHPDTRTAISSWGGKNKRREVGGSSGIRPAAHKLNRCVPSPRLRKTDTRFLIAVFFPLLPSLLLLPLTALLMFVCLQTKRSTRLLKTPLAALVLPRDLLLRKGLHKKEKEHQPSRSDKSAHTSGSGRDEEGWDWESMLSVGVL